MSTNFELDQLDTKQSANDFWIVGCLTTSMSHIFQKQNY
jgi:hypothetical protein